MCLFIVGVTAGCSDDDGGAPTCNWIFSKSDCPRDDSSDEVGDGDGDPDGDPPDNGGDFDACVVSNDGQERTVHQCAGSFKASIAFNTLIGDCGGTLGDPGYCEEVHEFGLGLEAYEMPAVMACCDAETASDQTVLRYCAADLVEQVCLSVPKRIKKLMDDGLIKVGKKQANTLRNWLDGHQQECYDALNRQGADAGTLESASWLVNDGGNKGWSLLKNFTIKIEQAEITAASLPDDADEYLSCFDNDLNNTEFFEGDTPSSPAITDVYRLAEASDAFINGPSLSEGRVVGAAGLASDANSCREPWCSTLEVSQSTSGYALADMSLFAEGSASLSYASLEFEVSRAAVRLYGVTELHAVEGEFSIEPGRAHFVISGVSGDVIGTRWASNGTALVMSKLRDGWVVDGFTVTYTDGQGYVWNIDIPQTIWN